MIEGYEIPEGWRKARFDELAFHISDRVDDPKEAGVEVYVGLEHLDPNSLKIKRRGTPDDVNATKLRVKPGQIIFGKRRAYQRKVAVADFEGICSAHAMVLEANPKTIAPGFLPFFMQSDIFFDRAIAISEGSLSPTIKWKTLANQEFLIPPIARQKELVELFQAIEDAIAATEESIAAAEQLKRSLIDELLTKGIGHTQFKQTEIGEIPQVWDVGNINDLASNLDSRRVPVKEIDRARIKGIYPYYGASGVIDTINKYIFEGEHVLLGEDGENVFSRKLPLAFIADGKFWVNNHAHIFKPKHSTNTVFLAELLESIDYSVVISGTAQPKLTKQAIEKILLPIPSKAEQDQIASIFISSSREIQILLLHREKLTDLKTQVVIGLLSGQYDLPLELSRELISV